MTSKKESKDPVAGREICITRLVNAPRDLVWEVWTNPEHIRHWWGPNGFYSTIFEMDVRPGGNWEFILHGPDGRDYKNKSIYTTVQRPEKLVYDHVSGPVFRFTVLFTEQGDQTQITIQMLFESADLRDKVVKEFNAAEGLKQNIDKLEIYLAGRSATEEQPFSGLPVIVERLFEAPVAKVWKAITDKDEMKNWYFDLDTFRPVTGFTFQFYGEGHTGEQYLHLCKITEVIEGRKISYTWTYQGFKGVSEVSFELFDEQGKTRLRLTHKGLTSFPADNPDFAVSSFREGWTSLLQTSLKNYLDGN